MARPLKFEREQLIERAVAVFWAHGYEATSLPALTSAMGILSGSLYNTFGDKRSLFLEALHYYQQRADAILLGVLHEGGTGKAALSHFFETLANRLASDAGERGCLLSNTALECTDLGDPALEMVEQHRVGMEKAFVAVLLEAQQAGEMRVCSEEHTRVVAQTLVNAMQGLRLTAKTMRNSKTLRQIAAASLFIVN